MNSEYSYATGTKLCALQSTVLLAAERPQPTGIAPSHDTMVLVQYCCTAQCYYRNILYCAVRYFKLCCLYGGLLSVICYCYFKILTVTCIMYVRAFDVPYYGIAYYHGQYYTVVLLCGINIRYRYR
jgi:hypothetical protein